MNPDRLRAALRDPAVTTPAHGEEEAWAIVHAAYRHRVTAPRARTQPRLALAIVAVLAIVAALALSPAGARVRDWIEDVIQPGSDAHPALTSLPAPGRLLVDSPQGAWIVGDEGAKRLLGAYGDSAWSPGGLYVAATQGRELTAVVADPEVVGEPAGMPHWSLVREQRVTDPAWAPSGILVAYLAGRTLHVVAGDGADDRLLAAPVAATAPAWAPDPSRQGNLLAYVDSSHRIRVANLDSGLELWHSGAFGGRVVSLDWSADGRRLLVLSRSYYAVLTPGGLTVGKGPTGGVPEAAAFSPTGNAFALARRGLDGTSQVVLVTVGPGGIAEHRLLSRPGHLASPAWSPDGEWLLVPWREADTWIFVRPSDGRTIEYSEISRQFAPGTSGTVGFPTPAGWCCGP